jgi:putative aminopeptidase FrvX
VFSKYQLLTTAWGGFMIAEVARLLHGQSEITVGLYITNSVQEEVGSWCRDDY